MASLRDYVSEKLLKFPNQNGWWVKCELSDSGYQGDTGPELSDVYYNYTKHIMYNNVECEASIEQKWTKLYNEEHALQAFYPIIGISLDTDDEAYVTGALHEIGEGQWWDTSFGGGKRDDLISGGLANYKVETKFSGDLIAMGYAKDEYNFAQYYEGGFSYPENYVREGGFNEVAHYYMSPYYDRYFYKVPLDYPGQQINLLMEKAFVPPQYISGNARVDLNGNPLSPFYVSSNAYTENTPMLVAMDTNVPVIVWDYNWYNAHANDVNSAMHSYLTDGDLTRFHTFIEDGHAVLCNGYVAPSVIDGTKQYNMYCDIFNGYWDEDSVEDETSGSQSNPNDKYRYLQVWVAPSLTQQTEPRVSLYKAKYGNELRCNIKVYGDLRQYKYSTDGGNSWTTVEKEGQTPLELPWEYMFYKRTTEKGWLSYDKNHGGNMLLFDSEALCDDGSPWLASDYNEKNFYYPTTNETGTPEVSTLMGTTGLRSVFSKKYVVQYSDLVTIANALFSTGGMVEDLKKGLEMFGNPIEAIQGLMYFPVNLADYFSLVTSSTVIIGGYEIPNTNAMLLSRYNGYFDVGSIQIIESFPGDDYRNFEPYCNLNIFLPFVGLESLKMNKYVGKTMSIRYYIDATTGECMACLFADGLLTDYFTGQMGVHLPISLHDYSQFAGASMQALAGIAENGANAVLSVPKGDVSGVVQGVTGFESGMFNLKQNSINNFVTTKGTSSSLLNHYLPNYVYVIFEIVETDETSNLLTIEGRRSNASGTVGSFSGFLQVESVNLKASGATESEKRTIKDLLASGIYI